MEDAAGPGWEIIMTKWAALSWTVKAVKDHEEALKKELPAWFLHSAGDFEEYLDVSKERRIAADLGIKTIYELSDSGVFLKVKLSDIPILQETVEISDILDENPYQLPSKGCVLLAVKDAAPILEELQSQGVEASLIGRFTDSHDRLIIGREGVRYLEPSTRENFT